MSRFRQNKWGVRPTDRRWPGRKITASRARRQRYRQWCVRLARMAYQLDRPQWPHAKPRQVNLLKLTRAAYRRTMRQLVADTGIPLARLARIENDFVVPTPAKTRELAFRLVGSEALLFCWGRYADPRAALDVMAGFAPFQRAPIRRMLRLLLRELGTVRASAGQPTATTTSGASGTAQASV